MVTTRTQAFPDYPYASHTLARGSLQLHYIDEGPSGAEPMVMIHGNPTWSFYYRHLIGAFRGGYRTIVPDHMGMGLSTKPYESQYCFTLQSRVADLKALLDSLEIRRNITLVLHDWGGMIGMAYAVEHPEAVSRIVVLNTGAFTLPTNKALPWQLRLARAPLIGSLLVRGLNAFSRGAVRDCVVTPLTQGTAAGYLAPYDTWHNRLAVHRFIQDIPLDVRDPAFETVMNTEKRLALFRDVPMLICWGMRDFVFDVHFLNRWLDFFPRAEVHRFPDAGHYVLEDAGDQITALIAAFLAKHPLKANVG